MFAIVLLIVLAVVGIILIVAGAQTDSLGLKIGGVIAIFVGIGILVFASTVVVPTKQVGIPVSYGKPGTPMTSGFHVKAPWVDVVIMDATVQDVDNAGDNPTVAKDADDADVYVHNLVRWSIQEDAADSLYRDYREFDRLNDSLVQPEIKTAIASVMSQYNPLNEEQPTNDELSTLIQARLQERVGDRIQVHSVSVSLIDFAPETKNRINALNSERANTRIAEQKSATAEKEAEANRILAASVSNDPNVLVANCLKMVENAEPGKLPAGFNCYPGSNPGLVVGAR